MAPQKRNAGPPADPAAAMPCPAASDEVIVCHLAGLADPDLAIVHFLARLQLKARRDGQDVLFCHAPPALGELIAFLGLADVIDLESGRQTGRQAEQREQPGGVEERVHGDDPAV